MIVKSLSNIAPEGIEIEPLDIKDIPIYSEDLEASMPQVVIEFAKKVKESDGIIISTPEYNGNISGVLHNTLDWLSRGALGSPMERKPVGIIGSTVGGFGAVKAVKELIAACSAIKAYPMTDPVVRISKSDQKFDEAGKLIDTRVEENLKNLIEELIHWANKVSK